MGNIQNEEFITDAEFRFLTGFSKSKAANDRWRRVGVPFYRISRRCIRYRKADVLAFLEGFRVETELDAKPAAREACVHQPK